MQATLLAHSHHFALINTPELNSTVSHALQNFSSHLYHQIKVYQSFVASGSWNFSPADKSTVIE
ncbi:hypothetical protein IKN40_03335 [bacterium]|nr:hypothetical protein [bacterium]